MKVAAWRDFIGMQTKGPQRAHNKGKSHAISNSWQDEEHWIKGLVYLVEKAGNTVVLNSNASREKIFGVGGFFCRPFEKFGWKIAVLLMTFI